MWQESRQRQMAQFENMAIENEPRVEGHGAHAVTPEQVRFITMIL